MVRKKTQNSGGKVQGNQSIRKIRKGMRLKLQSADHNEWTV